MSSSGGGAWTRGEVVNTVAMCLVGGTVLMVWLGLTQKRDFFLLLGNLCCVIGNGMFVHVIRQEALNQSWALIYGFLGIVSLCSLYSQFNKFRKDGFMSESDDEDKEDEDGVSEKTVAEEAEKIMNAQRHLQQEKQKLGSSESKEPAQEEIKDKEKDKPSSGSKDRRRHRRRE